MRYRGSNQRPPEYHTWMCICIGMRAQSYVELGVGSSWEQHNAGMVVVTVDLNPTGFPHIPHIQGNSQEKGTLHKVLSTLGDRPDIVFIDADHTYDGCKADFELWYPVARLAVGFHDTRLPQGCDQFWKEISRNYPSVEIVSRDIKSALEWQTNADDSGDVNAGGIGVIWK